MKMFIIASALFLGVFAHAGPRVIGNGEGPDVEAQEFVNISNKILQALRKSAVPEADVISQAVDHLEVGSSNQTLNDTNDDFFYTSYFDILTFRAQVWNHLPSPFDKAHFVMRGFLVVANIQDPGGSKSLELIRRIGFAASTRILLR